MGRVGYLTTIFRSVDDAKIPILVSALSVFSKIGYGANITAIAKAAGLSKQRVLYHFKSADEILFALADFWGQTGRQVTIEHLAGLNASSSFDKILGISDGL